MSLFLYLFLCVACWVTRKQRNWGRVCCLALFAVYAGFSVVGFYRGFGKTMDIPGIYYTIHLVWLTYVVLGTIKLAQPSVAAGFE